MKTQIWKTAAFLSGGFSTLRKGDVRMQEQEYEVVIREILERKVSIKAESREMVENIAREAYRAEKIVLDSDDFCGMEMEVSEKHTIRKECR